MIRHLLILLLACTAGLDPLRGEEPLVTKISENIYEIGGIQLNKKERSITFDARVNEVDQLIEFVLVNPKGKTHESIFVSEVNALKLNVAFKLLGFKASKELFDIPGNLDAQLKKALTKPAEGESASRLAITITWKEGEETKQLPLNQLILNNQTGKAMADTSWLYTGSFMAPEGFIAEATGDLIAIFTAPGALVNFPGHMRKDDEAWEGYSANLPPVDTPVKFVITAHQ